jgi:CDP-paratose 2-epimerase
MLEATRKSAPDAVFIFMSTNKVYGNTPNHLPLVELETRDLSRFQAHYPNWKVSYDVPNILRQIFELNVERWREACVI